MLEVRKLNKIYGLGEVQVRALDGISFTIADGDMICIMGKSGSGKSTLLRQLGLLDLPSSGEILIDNEVVTRLSDDARATLRLRHLGYVFQEYALLAELTAHENVYLPGMMLAEKGVNFKKRAKELLELVGLGKRIFADEPCANLDTISSKKVMETLVNLNQEMKVTIIFVSHDPDDKRYARGLIMLSDGKMVKEGDSIK
jgi:putative ABC transport system ATP-binding protein